MEVDYIIVGQGIAGTLLAYRLKQEGKTLVIIDDHHRSAASHVTAGIINPVTGRRYVKSWMIDELIHSASTLYPELEKALNTSLYHTIPVIRTLFNHREVQDWDLRSADPSYEKYVLEDAEIGRYKTYTQAAFAYGQVAHSANVEVGKLINQYRKTLKEEASLIEEAFDFHALLLEDSKVQYKNIIAQKIIFCEGQGAINNPYFNYLPFTLNKGEALIARIPNAKFERILKQRIFIVPLHDDLYWIGSTTEQKYDDDHPTQDSRNFLTNRLKDILTIPFEIVEHRAAIRPTVRDRRPFIGTHPKYNHLLIFNGLGTKGTSLSPYFSKHLVDFMLYDQALMKEVDIQRFERFFDAK